MPSELTTIDDRPCGAPGASGEEERTDAPYARWRLQAEKARSGAMQFFRAHESKRLAPCRGPASTCGFDQAEVDRHAERIAQYLVESEKLFDLTIALARGAGG